ncbi:HAD family hydrolase [Bacteroides sp. 224]|uniref:HAD family hydrolase n=1 Tax=Bacteroides sp. 224 TaxID=2302936 RepID=UPI0013D0BF40|nr:HAD family hydrolase [Bacteroides sp. 224]NDV64461.1 haloacid dehalogenase-like hydrolase [Bacteroides sp. 224]
MKKVVAFDFDGTITKQDTLLEFLKFTHGWKSYLYLLFLSPILLAYKLGIIKNYIAKEKLFSLFYKGWTIEDFNSSCSLFASTIETYSSALECIKEHISNNNDVIIISASLENWIYPWAISHNIHKVLATQVEVSEGKITGTFLSKNCYGQEKVNRLLQYFPMRDNYYLIVYGDSKGDKELLEYADERHFKKFNIK